MGAVMASVRSPWSGNVQELGIWRCRVGRHLEPPQQEADRPGFLMPPTADWQAAVSRPSPLTQLPCCFCRQPKPFVLDKQGGYSRGFLAWNMSDYEDTDQRNSKRAILVKQSKLLRTTLPSRLPKLPRKEEKVSCHFLNHA